MPEIEQATAAPGEQRETKRTADPTLCHMAWGVALADQGLGWDDLVDGRATLRQCVKPPDHPGRCDYSGMPLP